jgi:hypothetical protein
MGTYRPFPDAGCVNVDDRNELLTRYGLSAAPLVDRCIALAAQLEEVRAAVEKLVNFAPYLKHTIFIEEMDRIFASPTPPRERK